MDYQNLPLSYIKKKQEPLYASHQKTYVMMGTQGHFVY
jgi:tetrahydromethanopterin S-methyltransferase subunit D